MKRNTLSKRDYALETVFWAVIAFITYEKYMPRMYRVITLVAMGICVLAAVCISAAKVQARTKRRRIFTKARMTYLTVRLVGAAVSASFIVCLFCRTYVGGALLSSGENATSTYGDEYTIAENIDTVLLLQEEE